MLTAISDIFALLYSYLLVICTIIAILYLVYLIVLKLIEPTTPVKVYKPLPKLKMQDLTLEELRSYDGIQGEGRILIAVNGNIFDTTRGKNFYGPGGPYHAYAGRDASRCLARFNFDVTDEYDDLSDLTTEEMEGLREWEIQFTEKYDLVGKLVKPGEEKTVYPDEEKVTDGGNLTDTVKPKNE